MIAALSLLDPVLESVASAGAPQVAPSQSLEGPDKGGSVTAAGADFGKVFDQVGEAINTLKAGEADAISGLQGQSSVQHVVDSVMSAQRSLQTVVAIRDKVVSAYQSLSQMAI